MTCKYIDVCKKASGWCKIEHWVGICKNETTQYQENDLYINLKNKEKYIKELLVKLSITKPANQILSGENKILKELCSDLITK